MAQVLRDCSGSVASYVALIGAVGVGAGALAVDIGQIVTLKAELQNRADAAAMAAAAQLDGRGDSAARATSVAYGASDDRSAIAGGASLTVSSVRFFETLAPPVEIASSDPQFPFLAHFVQVTVTPQDARFFFSKVFNLLSTTGSASSAKVDALAAARPEPFVCHAPPLMICDPGETDPSLDPTLPQNAGRQLRLKGAQGGNATMAPGNFGLLALPDGSSGAADISAALAAVTPADCYSLDVTTATGSKTNQVKSGINTRFGRNTSRSEPPAPNVQNYPRDQDVIADPDKFMGSGSWDRNAYAKNSPWPASLDPSTASRYQVYLGQLGERFAVNGGQTLYPVPEGPLPAGFTEIPAGSKSLPPNGAPSQAPAPNGALRRVVLVAMLRCKSDDVHGSHSYPTYGRYLQAFITEEVQDPPDAAIYGEIIGPAAGRNPNYHPNVRLAK